MAWWLIISAIYICGFLSRVVGNTAQDTDIIGFIVGLIIYVIAWIMKQAQQLQQEQELVI